MNDYISGSNASSREKKAVYAAAAVQVGSGCCSVPSPSSLFAFSSLIYSPPSSLLLSTTPHSLLFSPPFFPPSSHGRTIARTPPLSFFLNLLTNNNNDACRIDDAREAPPPSRPPCPPCFCALRSGVPRPRSDRPAARPAPPLRHAQHVPDRRRLCRQRATGPSFFSPSLACLCLTLSLSLLCFHSLVRPLMR